METKLDFFNKQLEIKIQKTFYGMAIALYDYSRKERP